MSRLNLVFWLFFIVIGVIIIIGAVGRIFFVDLLIGLIVIVLGIARLSEELSKFEFEERHKKIESDLGNISTWMNDNYAYTKKMKDRHENRMHRLDNKRVDIERELEIKYRDIVRKVIDIENKLQEVSRLLVKQPIRSGKGVKGK